MLDDLRGKAADAITGKPKNRLNYIMVITSLGKSSLDRNVSMPRNQWLILNHLNESGPSTIRDIARETNIDEQIAVGECRRMNGTYVRKSSGGTEE
ncbi:MAG: MarR family transcriptional regulator [Nitrososphaerota archaeon]|nr:MarR family transcriptional regulator [Nitrososphaerota archaeon]